MTKAKRTSRPKDDVSAKFEKDEDIILDDVNEFCAKLDVIDLAIIVVLSSCKFEAVKQKFAVSVIIDLYTVPLFCPLYFI